jgi:serine/threonine-protein phosphatase 2A regulatory subunit B
MSPSIISPIANAV